MKMQPKITRFFSSQATASPNSSRNSLGSDNLELGHSSSDLQVDRKDNNENDSYEYIQVDVDPADVICDRSTDELMVEVAAGIEANVDYDMLHKYSTKTTFITPSKSSHRTPSRVCLSNSASKSIGKKSSATKLKSCNKLRLQAKKTPQRSSKPPASLSEPPSPCSSSSSSDVAVEDGIIGMKVRSPTGVCQRPLTNKTCDPQ